MTDRDILFAVCHACNDNWQDVMDMIRNRNFPTALSPEDAAKYDGCLTILDKDYPESLKQTLKPPFVISKDMVNLIKDKVLVLGNDDLNVPNSICHDDVYLSGFVYCGELDNIFASLCSCLVVGYIDKREQVDTCKCVCSFLNLGKDVYVRPTVESSMNNSFIKDGAYLFDSVNDLK